MRGFGEAARRRREPSRGAEGGGGVDTRSPLKEGPGNGAVPSIQNFFSIFGLQIATFGALCGLFLRFCGLFWVQTAVA